VASDSETAAYVEELEQRADELEESEELPSGDALAEALTRYLRDREQEGNGTPPSASESRAREHCHPN